MKSRSITSTNGLTNTLVMILVSSFLLGCSYFAGYVSGVLEERAATAHLIEPPTVGNGMPFADFTKCPDDVDLWNCVRNVMYREDI